MKKFMEQVESDGMLRNFFLTGLIFALSGGVFWMTLGNLDPIGEQRFIAYFSFFLSLFFGVGAFFTFVFFFWREIAIGQKLGMRQFLVAVRRGILVAVFVSGMAVLQLFRLLGVLEVVLLATFLVVLELIFLSTTRK